ncbi:unnamed protein product [Enterobius vermicularis]|uniref:RRM domain-containing protein n=1 Tax=Enterobius vermicularis TaxID=51028 RepID=A0A0N4VEJ9_ENTVE|nr:unnamed protein product [Enterobius vermicularis]
MQSLTGSTSDIPSDLNHNEQFKGNSRDGETEPYLHNDSETALNFSLIKRKQDWDEEQIEMLRWLVKHGYDAATAKKLVVAAYKLEPGRTYPMGRVIRTRDAAIPVVWEGELPARNYVNPVFSRKVFIGGVPWDITEMDLWNAFREYGIGTIEWPKKASTKLSDSRNARAIGYVYIIFEEEASIRKLLRDCTRDYGSAGEYHYKLSARRAQSSTEIRQVQVIPWVVSDSVYVSDATTKIERERTVFVGALHGMLTSEILYSIMNEIYGSVVFVCLDNDKYKYPMGSGRITFASDAPFFQAIEDGFLEIRTSKFVKKLQIDPFLDYSKCSQCLADSGTYFCRNRNCFKYFCANCWEVK